MRVSFYEFLAGQTRLMAEPGNGAFTKSGENLE